jgi:hypothetical protein
MMDTRVDRLCEPLFKPYTAATCLNEAILQLRLKLHEGGLELDQDLARIIARILATTGHQNRGHLRCRVHIIAPLL